MIKNMEKDDFKHECCSHWHPCTPLLQLAVVEQGIPSTGGLSVGVPRGSSPTAVGAHLPLDYSC